mmetsp:Transcript_45032/g.80551  ORF Transcript_45032/g.80551 Transcript_45032/m.80551 type:complete len:128 (-) Transcript_45032:481-864(-)
MCCSICLTHTAFPSECRSCAVDGYKGEGSENGLMDNPHKADHGDRTAALSWAGCQCWDATLSAQPASRTQDSNPGTLPQHPCSVRSVRKKPLWAPPRVQRANFALRHLEGLWATSGDGELEYAIAVC